MSHKSLSVNVFRDRICCSFVSCLFLFYLCCLFLFSYCYCYCSCFCWCLLLLLLYHIVLLLSLLLYYTCCYYCNLVPYVVSVVIGRNNTLVPFFSVDFICSYCYLVLLLLSFKYIYVHRDVFVC